jgi:hypothetical protein
MIQSALTVRRILRFVGGQLNLAIVIANYGGMVATIGIVCEALYYVASGEPAVET